MNNRGFIKDDFHPDDYVLGSSRLDGEVLNPSGDWRGYLPMFEHQSKGIETQSCVTFGTLSALEMIHIIKYGIEPNYSDRFISKLSGTSRSGNTPKTVAHTIRKKGNINEDLHPFTDDIDTWEEYFSEIPSELLKIGAKWLSKHSFSYEWVYTGGNFKYKRERLKRALQFSPIGVSVFAWAELDRVYVQTGGDNHWVVLVAFEGNNPIIFDSYEKKLKKLHKDYDFGLAMRYELTEVEKKLSPIQRFWHLLLNWFYSINKANEL